MIMPVFIPLPGPEEALALICQTSSSLFLNILLSVHFSAGVQEWPHHHSYEFSQIFQWNQIVHVFHF